MADVTPDDVLLTTWRSLAPPTVQMTPPGYPKLPTEAALSGALTIEFPDIYALAIVTVRGAPRRRPPRCSLSRKARNNPSKC